MNDPLAAIDKLLSEMPDKGPPKDDEFTIYQYMDSYAKRNKVRISLPTAYKQLEKMLDDGLVVMRKGRVNDKQGNIYKLVPSMDKPKS